MWNDLRREFQQRRQYLLVIVLGCLVMVIGVITSLSSLRFSSSSNRFLGPILTFVGFTAILFGVRWRKSILTTEQQQVGLTMGEIHRNFPTNQMSPYNINNRENNYLNNEMAHHPLSSDENKFLVAPAYSAPGFPAPQAPFPVEPPPPYEPPPYETAVSNPTTSQTHVPLPPVSNPATSQIGLPPVS